MMLVLQLEDSSEDNEILKSSKIKLKNQKVKKHIENSVGFKLFQKHLVEALLFDTIIFS